MVAIGNVTAKEFFQVCGTIVHAECNTWRHISHTFARIPPPTTCSRIGVAYGIEFFRHVETCWADVDAVQVVARPWLLFVREKDSVQLASLPSIVIFTWIPNSKSHSSRTQASRGDETVKFLAERTAYGYQYYSREVWQNHVLSRSVYMQWIPSWGAWTDLPAAIECLYHVCMF
jgi:hypothetical protein